MTTMIQKIISIDVRLVKKIKLRKQIKNSKNSNKLINEFIGWENFEIHSGVQTLFIERNFLQSSKIRER